MKPDKIILLLTFVLFITCASWFTSCTHVANIANLPEMCFSGDILPIFINNCAISGCHDGAGRESHMALNSYTEIMRGISPGNPDASRLYQTIIAKWTNRMPPSQPLSIENRTKIRVWIEQGANETLCTDTTGTVGTGGQNNYVARACFTRDILPVISSRCASAGCHDALTHAEGYNLTTYTSIRNTVSAGSPSNSRLYRIITTSGGENQMPPANKPQITTAEIDSIGKWITYGALNENCGDICDTINPVTFSATIWPVIQSTCIGCHSGTAPSGNVLLASYSNVATVASNGALMNSLNGAGVTKMPPTGSLSACRIKQFQTWVNNGFLNN